MCPKCDADECRVLETRRVHGTVYRRRECADCSHEFITLENMTALTKFPWVGFERPNQTRVRKSREKPAPRPTKVIDTTFLGWARNPADQ